MINVLIHIWGISALLIIILTFMGLFYTIYNIVKEII